MSQLTNKLTKISDKLFINLDEVESIEVLAILYPHDSFSKREILIKMKSGESKTAVIEWWRLSIIAPNNDRLSDEQNNLINSILESLTQEGYPPSYLKAFLRIINLSNWNNYTEWALFQFVKHLDKVSNLDMRLMRGNDEQD